MNVPELVEELEEEETEEEEEEQRDLLTITPMMKARGSPEPRNGRS